jgi:hypothetical protein
LDRGIKPPALAARSLPRSFSLDIGLEAESDKRRSANDIRELKSYQRSVGEHIESRNNEETGTAIMKERRMTLGNGANGDFRRCRCCAENGVPERQFQLNDELQYNTAETRHQTNP